MTPPIIYNLFPRLAGSIDAWLPHTERASRMGFNWVMLNPVNFPGFSGSIYSIKDFFKLDPVILPEQSADPIKLLEKTVTAMHDQGLKVMFDLVVNHTSKDSPLIKEKPTWFRRNKRGFVMSPSAIDPAEPGKVTVWRDLAEIDNADSPDRDELWAYWRSLVEFYSNLGFDGFRCDAAYKVPASLWRYLIDAARKKNPDALFAAETLGCRTDEVHALHDAGFDYLFNSSKWWNFDQDWCLGQHAEFAPIAPSISFPESHDTKRLFLETKGLVQVQKQRYAFGTVFAAGVLMPIGYEFCFRRRLHVVRTRPEQWEDTAKHDICDFIQRVNACKLSDPVLSAEGRWEVFTDLGSPTTVLSKREQGVRDPAVVVINKDWHGQHEVHLGAVRKLFSGEARLARVCHDQQWQPQPVPDCVQLIPAEVAFIVAEG